MHKLAYSIRTITVDKILLPRQIGFGFCKGDDNYGGVKRKELDDFLKSLGKTYNLVLYRMQVLQQCLNPL